MRTIFLTIFTFIFFAATADEQTGDGPRCASGVRMIFAKGAVQRRGNVECVRDIDREVTRLFRAPQSRSGVCRVIFSPRVPPDTVRMARRAKTFAIIISDEFDRQSSEAGRGDLAGALLTIRFGLTPNGKKLPYWISAGLEHIRRSSLTSGKLVRNIRYYPLLQSMLAENITPDWEKIVQLTEPPDSSIARRAASELSRVVLEAATEFSTVGENSLGNYAAAILESSRPHNQILEATLKSNKKLKDSDFLFRYFDRAAFNAKTPRPVYLSLRQLPQIIAMPYQSMPPPGKPNAPPTTITGTCFDLPELIRRKHPSALVLQSRLAQRVRDFVGGMPGDIANKDGGAFVGAIDTAAPSEKEMRLAYNNLIAALNRQQAMEVMLNSVEHAYTPPVIFFAGDLAECANFSDCISRKATEFLLQTENKYLSE